MGLLMPLTFKAADLKTTYQLVPAQTRNPETSKDGNVLLIQGCALPWAESYFHPGFGVDINFDRNSFDQYIAKLNRGTAQAYFAADDHHIGGQHLHAKSTIKSGEGSLHYWTDDEGLQLEAQLVDDIFGRAIYKRIELGILDKLSIGVHCKQFDQFGDDDNIKITYTDCEILETSAVAFPAFTQTWLQTAESMIKLSETSDESEGEQETQPDIEPKIDTWESMLSALGGQS